MTDAERAKKMLQLRVDCYALIYRALGVEMPPAGAPIGMTEIPVDRIEDGLGSLLIAAAAMADILKLDQVSTARFLLEAWPLGKRIATTINFGEVKEEGHA